MSPSHRDGLLLIALCSSLLGLASSGCRTRLHDAVSPPDGAVVCDAKEICGNGFDDNCDGQVDEGCACAPGDVEACYPRNPAQAGVGVCVYGKQTCVGDDLGASWGPCEGAGAPETVLCGGGQDYRCDGIIDEGCACPANATRACYDGPAKTEGVADCHGGSQRCIASGSTAAWTPCAGEVTPTPDGCAPGDDVDHDCDGVPHSGCTCLWGQTKPCYDGPAGSLGVGTCRGGTATCMQTGPSASAWSACAGQVLPAKADRCSPPLDTTCNGQLGDGCMPCFQATTTPWQFHDTPAPMCLGMTFPSDGDPAEYAFASIPPVNDPGWVDYPSSIINFSRKSRLCELMCACRGGVDFDYWQTSLSVPPNYAVTSLVFNIANADDGVSITVFNEKFPDGEVDPGSFTTLGGSTTSNLASYVVPGENRIVLTHVDDCCVLSAIMGASIMLDGTNVGPCQ